MSRPQSAAVRTLTRLVPVSRHALFRFLADIENLPRWAPDFCPELELSCGRWLAYTMGGDCFVEIEADERSGTIDLRWGGEREGVRLLALRLVTLPGGANLISAVCYRGPGMDDLAFEREVAALTSALESVGRLDGAERPCCRLAV
ncbi:MAG: hypothetical protein C0502_07215 [Opitutus sp.]|nr:hypothetical protein [Opitutus sp.]